jgi:hypothetical protein
MNVTLDSRAEVGRHLMVGLCVVIREDPPISVVTEKSSAPPKLDV